jgi:maleylpyruvate isomerase
MVSRERWQRVGTAAPSSDTSAMLATVGTAADILAHSVADLDDRQAAAPSGLPGWTRGHVLSHVARNADALVDLLTWARTGVEAPMYPSREVRDRDIEGGAGRPAEDLRTDALDSQAATATLAVSTRPSHRCPAPETEHAPCARGDQQ